MTHPSSVREEKRRLRDAMKQRIAALSTQDRQKESLQICDAIIQSLPKEHTGICAFSPLPDEPDILPALREILSRGHALFLPRFDRDVITFHRVASLDGLNQSARNILEPPADAPQSNAEEISLVLVPGRAFDAAGNRLGRGIGGYDTWIARQRDANPRTRFLGIAFACQVVAQVPMEEHDERVEVFLFR